MKIDILEVLSTAKDAAIAAGAEIMKIYSKSELGIELKSDDSPLTLADRAAHKSIVEILEKTALPILSEEGRTIAFDERKKWDYFWMVDPLDGTKEFIKRNGEFTVNIALIHQNRTVAGVVFVPATGELYFASQGSGAFKKYRENTEKLSVNTFSVNDERLNVVASRSHLNEETETFLNGLHHPVIVSKGSSLKLLMVADGSADLYPRYAPTMEWDTAAAQIIVEEAGGKVLVKDSQRPMDYNKEDLLNPYFLVTGNQVD